MDFNQFTDELNLQSKVLSIIRKNGVEPECPVKSGCALRVLNNVMQGETVRLSLDAISCNGGKGGFGFTDEAMRMPGGYGCFISYGSKEDGAPHGMRLKQNPELAKQGAQSQPKGVMEGFSIIEIKPFQEADDPDLVTIFAAPDQLAALTLLYGFRRIGEDHTIFPGGSGCSTIFRLPFAELGKEAPRAVIGNADVSSRVYFDAGAFFFTISGTAFKQMLEDAGESFLIASAWRGVKKRL